MGVVYASIVAATQNDAPLALISENPWAVTISLIAFTVVILGFYAWTKAQAAVPAVPGDDAPTPEATYR